MTINLLVGLAAMTLCLLLQTLLLLTARRYYLRHLPELESPSLMASLMVVNAVMFLLVLGNLGQVAVWALVYVWLGEFAQFTDAYYHSAVNFATLGYGDIVMSPQYRLLGPLESVNGVLMIGVSTATLMTVFQDALSRTMKARQ